MQVITDIEQGSDAWLAARLGIVTCSELSKLLVNGKGVAGFGADALSYMDTLIGERITEEAAELPFTTRSTERGHILEEKARELYVARQGGDMHQAAIILNHGVGYSPDFLVGKAGLGEIKTKLPKFQVGVLLAGEIPKEHVAQCQGGLWVSEREWIDFISYWPGMPMFIKRAYRDEAYISHVASRVRDFYEILEERMERVMGAA